MDALEKEIIRKYLQRQLALYKTLAQSKPKVYTSPQMTAEYALHVLRYAWMAAEIEAMLDNIGGDEA